MRASSCDFLMKLSRTRPGHIDSHQPRGDVISNTESNLMRPMSPRSRLKPLIPLENQTAGHRFALPRSLKCAPPPPDEARAAHAATGRFAGRRFNLRNDHTDSPPPWALRRSRHHFENVLNRPRLSYDRRAPGGATSFQPSLCGRHGPPCHSWVGGDGKCGGTGLRSGPLPLRFLLRV